jgi:hypothetical protein
VYAAGRPRAVLLEVDRHGRTGDAFRRAGARDADIVVGVAEHFLIVEENGATRSPHVSVAGREQWTIQDFTAVSLTLYKAQLQFM